MSESVALSAIRVGDRARKDMGDIAELARSIQAHGLMHPVVVLSDYTLVAGGRRLAAVGMLGWEEVPVTVVDVADLLSAERDENAVRKNLTPTEAVALGRLIEARHQERVKAQESDMGRQRVAKRSDRSGATSGQSIPAVEPLGRIRPIAAAAVGMSETTYQTAKAVVVAAEKDPETYGDLPSKMDETGNVSGTHEEMKRRRNGEAARSSVHYKAQYPKPNREMERGLITLEGLVSGFSLIDITQLDRTQTEEWAKRLKAAALFLSRLSNKVGRKND
jgi:ParB-like chromosome segregation protein Spo0J